MKTCKKCDVEKELSLFREIKANRDGYSNSCRECDSKSNKEYKEKNRERVESNKKIWREKNKDLIKTQKKEYREKNKEAIQEYCKEYYEDNKEKLQEYGRKYTMEYREKNPDYVKNYYENSKDVIKEYYEKNKEHIKEVTKKYRDGNKEYIKKQKKEYYEKNKEEINKRGREYYEKNKDKVNLRIKNKLKNDSFFKLKFNIRALIRNSFMHIGAKKNSKTAEILGCSFEEFKLHLESKFEDWMTWENRGLCNSELNYGWDIDHIIPLITAITEEDVIRLNHFSNLQPLCSHINRHVKKDRLDYRFI